MFRIAIASAGLVAVNALAEQCESGDEMCLVSLNAEKNFEATDMGDAGKELLQQEESDYFYRGSDLSNFFGPISGGNIGFEAEAKDAAKRAASAWHNLRRFFPSPDIRRFVDAVDDNHADDTSIFRSIDDLFAGGPRAFQNQQAINRERQENTHLKTKREDRYGDAAFEDIDMQAQAEMDKFAAMTNTVSKQGDVDHSTNKVSTGAAALDSLNHRSFDSDARDQKKTNAKGTYSVGKSTEAVLKPKPTKP